MAKGKKYLHGRKEIALGRGAENRINLPLLRQVQRLVEDLQAGDRVIPRDNGFQEIAWVGSKTMSSLDFARDPKPVFVKAGFLGNGLPERDMLLSPNHKVLLVDVNAELLFDDREVLVAAKHLVGKAGIQQADVAQTSYIHFMVERPEVVFSDRA